MAEEWMVAVDERDQPLAKLPRREFAFGQQIHRSTFVFVVDNQQRLCVQLRASHKGYCPGYRDLAAGGVVAWNESYQLSAQRELREELGLETTLALLGHCFHQSPGNRSMARIYGCRHDGPAAPQDGEVVAVEWLPLSLVLDSPGAPFTPDSLEAFLRVQHRLKYL